MTSRTSSPAAPRRNPVLVTIDILASALLCLLVGVLALGVTTTALSFDSLRQLCGGGPYEGVVCSPVLLGIVIYGLIVIAVIVAALGIGMAIVSLIRKRYTFWWPLGAIVIILVFFYLGTWLAGLTVPAT
ncbi:MAG: hypothetical protein ACOH19_04050 [Rhodoglobus sp.]